MALAPGRHLPPLLVLAALTLVLFRPFWWEGRVFVPSEYLSYFAPWKGQVEPPVHQNLDLFDVAALFAPLDTLLSEGLREGRIPLWNPYVFCGHPVVASGQSGFLYPVRLALHAVLDVGAARTVSQWLHVALMGLAMYWLLSRRVRRREAALLGAVAWMLNGFAMGWLEFEHVPIVAGLATLAMVMLDLGLEGRRWGYPACSVLLGLGLLAGHLQINLYALATVAFYLAFRAWETRSKVLPGVLALAAGVLLGGPALLPFFELLGLSARRSFTFEELQTMASPLGMLLPTLVCPDAWGNPALGFLLNRTPGNYIAPEFTCYAGVLPLALALGLAADREARRRLWPLYALAAGAMLAAAATPPYRLAVLAAPFLSQLVPGRALFLVPWVLAILAAEAADRQPESASLRKACALAAGGVAAAWAAWTALVAWLLPTWLPSHLDMVKFPRFQPGPEWPGEVVSAAREVLVFNPQVAFSLVLPLLAAAWLARRPVGPAALWALALLTGLDLLTFAVRFNPTSRAGDLFPPAPALSFLREEGGRVVPLGKAAPLDTLVPYRIPSVGGYESLVLRRYLDLLDRAEGKAVPMRMGSLTRVDSPVLDLLGVRWVLESPTSPPRDLDLAFDQGMRVYRRPGAVPRAWAVGRVHVLPEAAALDLLSWPWFRPLEEATVEVPLAVDPRATGSPVRVVEEETDRVVLEAALAAPGLVVLADAWYPGWEVRVDGQSAPLLRVDHALRGVLVPQGIHRCEFDFRPRSLRRGWLVALAGLGLTLLAWATRRHRA